MPNTVYLLLQRNSESSPLSYPSIYRSYFADERFQILVMRREENSATSNTYRVKVGLFNNNCLMQELRIGSGFKFKGWRRLPHAQCWSADNLSRFGLDSFATVVLTCRMSASSNTIFEYWMPVYLDTSAIGCASFCIWLQSSSHTRNLIVIAIPVLNFTEGE